MIVISLGKFLSYRDNTYCQWRAARLWLSPTAFEEEWDSRWYSIKGYYLLFLWRNHIYDDCVYAYFHKLLVYIYDIKHTYSVLPLSFLSDLQLMMTYKITYNTSAYVKLYKMLNQLKMLFSIENAKFNLIFHIAQIFSKVIDSS